MNKALKILSSVKIAVVCLFLLFVLTLWGTIAQVEHGLYAAQERYFFSFFFPVFGFLPFPGAQMVLWVLFVNLVASSIVHFSRVKGWSSLGLKISHIGILIYFVAAFITFHVTVESNVHLLEGQGTNLSASYHEWEIAYWTGNDNGNERQVTAVDVTKSKPMDILPFKDVPWTMSIAHLYLNSAAYTNALPGKGKKPINASGITFLEAKNVVKEREKNVAGVIVHLTTGDDKQSILLFGGETIPTSVAVGNQEFHFILRHKRYPLPFVVRLKDFKAEFHPGTKIAKSFESLVEVVKPNATRDVRIYMNNPLRERDYTFYQASYDIDARGREYSTLAVVKNSGQILPYIASFVVFFGLSWHFIGAALRRKRA